MWGRRVRRDDCGMLVEQPGQIRTEEGSARWCGVGFARILEGFAGEQNSFIQSFIHSFSGDSSLLGWEEGRSLTFREGGLPWAAPSVHLSDLMRTPAYGSSKYASPPYHGVAWPVVPKDARKKSTQVDASRTHNSPHARAAQSVVAGAQSSGLSLPRYRESAGQLTTPSDS